MTTAWQGNWELVNMALWILSGVMHLGILDGGTSMTSWHVVRPTEDYGWDDYCTTIGMVQHGDKSERYPLLEFIEV